MAKAKNAVIAGDYVGKKVNLSFGRVQLDMGLMPAITLDRSTVADCSVVVPVLDESQKKSMSSGVMRGLVGGAFLGPAGLVAGAVTAKQKGIYQIAIQLKEDPQWVASGKRFLIEVDDKIYKAIMTNCF